MIQRVKYTDLMYRQQQKQKFQAEQQKAQQQAKQQAQKMQLAMQQKQFQRNMLRDNHSKLGCAGIRQVIFRDGHPQCRSSCCNQQLE